jgi:uncharacterized protein
MRLVGTTKTTIAAIRDRTHWNTQQLSPADPVMLGLCSQIDLDFEVGRASKDRPVEVESATLLPAEITTGPVDRSVRVENPFASLSGSPRHTEDEDKLDLDSVFGKLKGIKQKD